MQSLKDQIAVVAGATRGAGRGIAAMLGEAGATVYCTGRSTEGQPSPLNRPETIEGTARLVDQYGGKGIAVQVDHLDRAQVRRLFERIRDEQGRLDLLVNDIWGGESLSEWGKPFWELSIPKGLQMQKQAIHTHIITSRYAAPLMIAAKRGLIIEITDGDTLSYRGNLFYDLAKTSVIRLALAMSHELREHGVSAVALTPGFLRSEEMLDHFGVTEATWQDGAKQDPNFIASETPFFVGRAVTALAADPHVAAKSGGAYSSWALAREYGFTDLDGSRPDWGKHFEETFGFPSGSQATEAWHGE